MKTPWINHSKMQEIGSRQMIVFKSSPSKVQNIAIAMNFICINEECEEPEKDVCELDSAPSRDCLNETNNLHENDDINNLLELHEKKYTDSTYDLYELSEGTDSKHVLKVDKSTETDNVFKPADSTDCKQDFKTISANEVNNTAQTDFIDHQHPSESDFMNEIRDPLEKEEVLETGPAEETKDITQTNFSFDVQHPSESDFMNEIRDSS